MRIRAWHPASGNTMSAEVIAVTGSAPRRSFRVIPDGLLEEVIVREGAWTVALDEESMTAADAMREMGLHRVGQGGPLDPSGWRP